MKTIATTDKAATGPRDLSSLAEQINDEHRQCESDLQSALQHAINAGQLLSEAKAGVDHGQWLPWLESNCTFSARTAQAYVRLAKHLPELESKAQHAAHLPVRESLALLAEPKLTKRVTRPRSSFTPPAEDEVMIGTADGDTIVIEPSAHDGFFYVSHIHIGREDESTTVHGTKRPIRHDRIDYLLGRFTCNWEVMTWETRACDERRMFNEWLFDSYEQYVQRSILGRSEVAA